MTDRFEHIHLFLAWSRNKNLVHKMIGNHGLYVFAPIQSQSEASPSRETREHVRGPLGLAPKVRCYYNPRLRWFGHFNVRRVLGPRRGQTDEIASVYFTPFAEREGPPYATSSRYLISPYLPPPSPKKSNGGNLSLSQLGRSIGLSSRE